MKVEFSNGIGKRVPEVQRTTRKSLLLALTRRERQVLECYVQWPFVEVIARELGSRPQTVRNQITSIKQKLGVRTRGELLIRYLTAPEE